MLKNLFEPFTRYKEEKMQAHALGREIESMKRRQAEIAMVVEEKQNNLATAEQIADMCFLDLQIALRQQERNRLLRKEFAI